ncbi:hypothetical protein DPMN_013331 [Dreissena polymorpha]|uniref:Uncharacterized protein n=1 Tax=Dreissena polymorpha TaxID=45954 RepID=A0A9D4N437_DREPO|nr:hypothetical protein DPMN_013331 [Dreissena polymorpha]
MLMALQSSLERQSLKLTEFNTRLNNMEQNEEYCDEMECDDPSYMMATEGDGQSASANASTKISSSDDSESRFQTMLKRLKAHEECSVNVDGVLAENMNEQSQNTITETKPG